jgi:acyl-CoA thioester hydrolase
MDSGYRMSAEQFRFATPIEIRFRDLDAFGHVNNAVYFTYMEMTRVAYFKRVGLLQAEFPSPFFIIAEATCQFKAPIRLTTDLSIKVRVGRLGNSSFDMDYEFVDTASEQTLATGRTVQVMFDYAQRRSVPIPEQWRATLIEFEGL